MVSIYNFICQIICVVFKGRRADATMFKDLDFVNTVTWRMGVTEKGYMIPLPEGKIMSGMPKLTVYKPFDPNFHSEKSGDDKG